MKRESSMDKKGFLVCFIIFLVSCSQINGSTILNTIEETRTEQTRTMTIGTLELPIKGTTQGIETVQSTMTPQATITSDNSGLPGKLKELPPGRYIAYVAEGKGGIYYTEIISEDGVEKGVIEEGGSAIISQNQKYMSRMVSKGKIIEIYNLENDTLLQHEISEFCKYSGGGISWSSDDSLVAIPCTESIIIFSIMDGKIIGEISYKIDKDQTTGNYHFNPKWSPNGKWIAYFVQTFEIYGPFVSDVSCISDEKNCEEYTKIIAGATSQIIDWTPDNQLAIYDMNEGIIKVINVEENRITRVLDGPDISRALNFVWSKEEEIIALGTPAGIEVYSSITGESKLLSSNGYRVKFWYYVL
jgi:hypothetical protein